MNHSDHKSAFRTRDEQVFALYRGQFEYSTITQGRFRRDLIEAEARGAGEERTKFAALEARIAELEAALTEMTEAEHHARADRDASRAREERLRAAAEYAVVVLDEGSIGSLAMADLTAALEREGGE